VGAYGFVVIGWVGIKECRTRGLAPASWGRRSLAQAEGRVFSETLEGGAAMREGRTEESARRGPVSAVEGPAPWPRRALDAGVRNAFSIRR